MSAVVPIGWTRLAVLAEVGVMAHGALVANALDVGSLSRLLAKRTVAVDAVVPCGNSTGLWQRLVDLNEAVVRMVVLGALDAL